MLHKGDCIHRRRSPQCSMGMKSGGLSLTSPCSGTKRKTAVPLFFASTGGLRLPSFMPILHLSLQFIDCCSPSVRRISVSTGGLRLSLLQPHTAIASTHCLYSPSLRRISVSTGGIGLLSFTPILHLSLQFIDCYSPSVRRLSINLLHPHPAKTALHQGKEYRLHHALGGYSLLQRLFF